MPASPMIGWIGLTDYRWYQRLLSFPSLDEANFWRPSTGRRLLAPGTPFFFKLRSPHNAICGFGRFAAFTVLPTWLAWEVFGTANGTADLDELERRTGRLRRGARIAEDAEGRIGCCLIAEPRVWPRQDWIEQPSDWRPRTQVGSRVDLSRGEGARIWGECQERLEWDRVRRAETVRDDPPALIVEPERGTATLVEPRLGQGIFRVRVLDAYERRCGVTGERSLPVLDAAHIRPHALGGPHAAPNGLCLRADLHRLFDRGYVAFDEDLRFVVSRRLREDYENGRVYYDLHGRALREPEIVGERPDDRQLAWHREAVFRG